MSGPIYEPRGAAKEYGDYALNIYTGCPHRCWYCFAPGVLHRTKEEFHSHAEPRNILVPLEKQLATGDYAGKTIHLCFTCDPYPFPTYCDTTPTREVIKMLKAAGTHVQILTKGNGSRDFDLLDGEDWYGITYTGGARADEPGAAFLTARFHALGIAHKMGIKTWISFEPVLNAEGVLLALGAAKRVADRVKIGKLNYHPSDINWTDFGRRAEALCQKLGLDYTIKESLRREMEAAT